MRRALAATLALFLLVWIVATVRYAAPAPAPVDAPRERFSALRAADAHRRLVDDGSTRAIGTEGNARGRAVVVSELERNGWLVETQRTWACSFHGACAIVSNVIGRLPGTSPGEHDAVLMSAHHDSVPAGPGASDDGLGVATLLESARALAAIPRPRRTIIALFTDGEEAGLLGAEAFLQHPLASSIGTTVNVDARGSRGPSQMFETSRGNAWLLALVGHALERPVTTSLFYEVYKRMPNDTDFTLTKTIAPGVNFANTAGIEHYHTPADDLASADLGTLQHHGDHVLSMVRAFAETPALEPASGAGDAVWFDVLATFIVQWPERLSLLLAIVALTLVAGRGVRMRAWNRGLFAFLSLVPGVLATLAGGWLLEAVGAIVAPWVAHPLPSLVALHLGGGLAVVGTLFCLARRGSPQALWTGTWLGWGLLGVLAAVAAPGASYLFIVPTLAAALASTVSFTVACVAPAVVASILLLALSTGLYAALGFVVPPATALPTLLLATTLAPMLVGLPRWMTRSLPLVLTCVALGAIAVARIVPRFSADHPQRVNVIFRQDDDARVFVDSSWGRAKWGAPPASMLDALGGGVDYRPALPWGLAAAYVSVPRIELGVPGVDVSGVEDDASHHAVRFLLQPKREGTTLGLLLPADRLVEAKVAGLFAKPRAVSGGRLLALHAVPKEGVTIELSARDHGGKIPLTILERSPGVPPATLAADAVRARPVEATRFQDGDQTVVTTTMSL